MNEVTLTDVEKEGSDPFADTETETPSESSTEKEPKAEEKSEDEVPFHKHPRWIERENELKELRERDEQTARELAELKAMAQPKSDESIPDWFTELYGDNKVAWDKYKTHEQKRTEEIESRILAKQEEERARVAKETEHWNKWVDDEINKLSGKGYEFDRNELIKTLLDYRPTDANNNFDFEAGYKIYDALRTKPDTAKSEARKELADTTTKSSNKGEAPKKDYMTPVELRNRSWGSL